MRVSFVSVGAVVARLLHPPVPARPGAAAPRWKPGRRPAGGPFARRRSQRLRRDLPRPAQLPPGLPDAGRVPPLQRRHPDHHPDGDAVRGGDGPPREARSSARCCWCSSSGLPFTFLFGALAEQAGAEAVDLPRPRASTSSSRSLAYHMKTAIVHFMLLAAMVGTVQGGTQALSRSLFATMIPRHKSAEFFGFYGVFEKFGGIFGPALFAPVIRRTGSSRRRDPGHSTCSSSSARAILWFVDVDEGPTGGSGSRGPRSARPSRLREAPLAAGPERAGARRGDESPWSSSSARCGWRSCRGCGRRAARGCVVAHHVNSLVDPLLIFAFVPGQPRFLAKSTLWQHPVIAPLVIVSDALPVYRHQDGVEVARNMDTFARAREILGQGGTVALFPEGRSHSEPRPLPLKTGAARIALHAIADDHAEGLRIIPIGVVYEDKGRFRSRVVLRVGEPIDPAPEAATYATEGRVAVRKLTDRIAAGLAEATPRGAGLAGRRGAGAEPGRARAAAAGRGPRRPPQLAALPAAGMGRARLDQDAGRGGDLQDPDRAPRVPRVLDRGSRGRGHGGGRVGGRGHGRPRARRRDTPRCCSTTAWRRAWPCSARTAGRPRRTRRSRWCCRGP